ncbi:MAG: hypothetical protein ACE5I2_07585 [Anaerolineae bacterium]
MRLAKHHVLPVMVEWQFIREGVGACDEAADAQGVLNDQRVRASKLNRLTMSLASYSS